VYELPPKEWSQSMDAGITEIADTLRARTQAASHTLKRPRPERSKGPSDARESSVPSISRELRCTLDDEARFVRADGAWRALLGLHPEQLLDRSFDEFVHPSDLDRMRRALERLRDDDGCVRDLQIRLTRDCGEYVKTVWTFKSGSGVEQIIGVGQKWPDTVRLERHNEELERRLAELEERYYDMERFAGMAAHQLAEPLILAESSAIMVAEELGESLDPILRDQLEAIGQGAARARQLMEALLQDARSAALPIELRPVAIGPIVEATLADLSWRIDEVGATTIVGPLPQVLGEPRMLTVIFANLISNALKYGPRQGAEVRIGAELVPDGWRLSVFSGGTPIPPAEADRIFEPFRRGSGERRAPGNGLGLAICARLVERMGGRIAVRPSEDGNDFSFVVPAIP